MCVYSAHRIYCYLFASCVYVSIVHSICKLYVCLCVYSYFSKIGGSSAVILGFGSAASLPAAISMFSNFIFA